MLDEKEKQGGEFKNVRKFFKHGSRFA